VDIEKKVADQGSVYFDDAVPILAPAGSVIVNNRQTLHGSFANVSDDRRISLNFGFLPRESVLGQVGVLRGAGRKYTASYVARRATCIHLGIADRAAWRPHEPSYVYTPESPPIVEGVSTDDRRAIIQSNYHRNDIGI
jgi:ectoine hydroxylase-related dioxygenase (phytanoyl-CoA dioxygenase family)